MTVAVANTELTNTFEYMRGRINELADAMTNKVVTVDATTTSGNAVVNGTVVGVTLVANTALRGGNTTTSNTLEVSSNLNISGVQFSVGANVLATSERLFVGNSTVNSVVNSTTISMSGNLTVNSTALTIGENTITANALFNLPATINTTTSGTSEQIVDSFLLATYRGSEYVVTITDTGANAYQMSKLLVLQDGGDGLATEYGVLFTNNQLGTFSSNANSTHCRLVFTPTVSATRIKGFKTLVVI